MRCGSPIKPCYSGTASQQLTSQDSLSSHISDVGPATTAGSSFSPAVKVNRREPLSDFDLM
jgi:hypothetical protein